MEPNRLCETLRGGGQEINNLTRGVFRRVNGGDFSVSLSLGRVLSSLSLSLYCFLLFRCCLAPRLLLSSVMEMPAEPSAVQSHTPARRAHWSSVRRGFR